MELKRWVSVAIRIAVALIVGFFLLRFAFPGGGQGFSALDRFFQMAVVIFYVLILFGLFGWPLLGSIGERIGNSIFMPSDANFQIAPEYSVAEAQAKKGRYQEAIDEYRKVILESSRRHLSAFAHRRVCREAIERLEAGRTRTALGAWKSQGGRFHRLGRRSSGRFLPDHVAGPGTGAGCDETIT